MNDHSERDIVRQGDVLLIAVPSRPPEAQYAVHETDATGSTRAVLAYGEVTGHTHVVAGPGVELYATAGQDAVESWRNGQTSTPGLQVYLTTPERPDTALKLTHEEHGAITIAPGTTYEVRRQSVYWHGQTQLVAD